jgi:hypothetical protein
MARMNIWQTSVKELTADKDVAPILTRLMITSNDLTLNDHATRMWNGEQGEKHKDRQVGAKMYFIRQQISLLYEEMKIIRKILKTPALMDAVSKCDAETQNAFRDIKKFIGTEDYKKIVGRLRNKVGFHLDEDVVITALNGLETEHPGVRMSMSWGEDVIDWHYEPGDRVIDRIVVRDIFDIPKDADIHEEIDKIVARLQVVSEHFAVFAVHFIQKITRKG